MGCIIGWSSPALEYLESSESHLNLTEHEKSWITPLLPAGQIVGYLIVPFVHKLINEKWTLLLFSIPQLISWFLIVISKNSYYINVARIAGGIGYAGGLCALTMYLTEISSQHNRGIFLAFIQFFHNVGFLFIILFDIYFHYYYMNIIIIGTMSCFVFVFIFMPDSSYFKKEVEENLRGEEMIELNGKSKRIDIIEDGEVKEKLLLEFKRRIEIKGKGEFDEIEDIELNEDKKEDLVKKEEMEESKDLKNKIQQENENSFKIEKEINHKNEEIKNRNKSMKETKNDKKIKKEIKIMENNKRVEKFNNNLKKNSLISKMKNSNFWKLFTIPTYRNAMLIVICVTAQEHFAGASVIKVFTQQIFKYTKSSMSTEMESLLLGIVKLIASMISIQLIEKYERKSILLYTGLFGTLGLIIAGIYFFFESSKLIDVTSFSWLSIFGILFYDFNFTIGISNFLYIYLGELFVGEIKSVAITVCKVICLIFIFINILLYQELNKFLGIHIIFGIYAINSILLLSILMKITPETKGRSLNEIQNMLKNKKLF